MIDLALELTAEGMGAVFAALSILAAIMWVMGKVARPFEEQKGEIFSEKELLAIAAAVAMHEDAYIAETSVPEKWKDYARIYAMRWSE